MTTESKISALLDAASGWTEAEFRALAMAALDQAGATVARQKKIAALIGVCIDCQLADAEYNDRCEPCCEAYDADRLELARDMEIDRRIDEARGK